jgi:hypothetical protein
MGLVGFLCTGCLNGSFTEHILHVEGILVDVEGFLYFIRGYVETLAVHVIIAHFYIYL